MPLRIHWGVEDPAAARVQDQPDAFETAFQILRRRALAFDALADKRDVAALGAIGDLA